MMLSGIGGRGGKYQRRPPERGEVGLKAPSIVASWSDCKL